MVCWFSPSIPELNQFFILEYKRSSAILRSKGLSDESPRQMYMLRSTPLNDIASVVLRDSNIVRCGTFHRFARGLNFSQVYIAIIAMLSPGKFSPAILFSLLKTCEKMSQTIRNAIREVATTQAAASELRALYDLQNVARVIVDGTVAYPRAGIDSESSNEGIVFDLR